MESLGYDNVEGVVTIFSINQYKPNCSKLNFEIQMKSMLEILLVHGPS